MLFTYTLFSLIVFVYADKKLHRVKRIVGGNPADIPPEDDPAVYTNFAGKSALVRGVRDFPHYVFRGIYYADPPTGKDRFLRPRQKFLEGNIDATNYPSPCIQPHPGTNNVIGDENCLALNIFTPELPTGTEGLPVVVWIHGGGFRYGSASQYGVRHLVGRRLVVVTIQYRLGSLGFLSSGTKELPGNVALWDMVLAIQWVRNYIGFFGGNPYRIVVMGHDTGASSALMVALSNIAKGLSAGVVAMSGTAVSQWAMDHTPQNTANDIAEQNGCPTTNAVIMVKCLQKLTPDSIIRGDSSVEFQRIQSRGFMSGLSGELGSAPVAEGYNDGRSLPAVVQDEPINDLDKSKNPKIPLLTGICKDETKKAVNGHFKEDIVKQLTTIPNFLDKVLVQNLRQSIPVALNLINNTLTNLIPLNFQTYLKLDTDSIGDALSKVADITNDALFNVPAFLTVDKWSKNGAHTYLYSFEHVGKLQKGSSFLRGSPFIGNSSSVEELEAKDTVTHGDELAYVFDVNDIYGNSLESSNLPLSKEDQKVRDIFTQMIADFAKTGKVSVESREVQPFSSKMNNFIQIKPKPTIANDFKYCEMALWCNIADRLKSTACSFLKAFDMQVKNVEKVIGGVLQGTNILGTGNLLTGGNSNKQNNKAENKNPLGLLLGGNSNKMPKQGQTRKPSFPNIGGLIG